MQVRLPSTAFAYYVRLGPERSYRRVAEYFGVSKQAVGKRAIKERWREELAKLEERARQRANLAAEENLVEMNERHLKTMQVIQKRAIESFRSSSILKPGEAVRALVAAIKAEREVRGDAEERTVRIVIG